MATVANVNFVCQQLGLAGKTETGGFKLWADVMEGDPKAQELMIEYMYGIII